MLNGLRNRLGARAVAVGVATILIGGGVAAALPEEAVEGQETAEANQVAAEEKALAAQEHVEGNQAAAEEKASTAIENAKTAGANGPPEGVLSYLNELEEWVGCIQAGAHDHALAVQEGARNHAEQQAGEDRVEDAEYEGGEYNEAAKSASCGDKPVNPNDVDGEAELEEGPEDDGDRGRPEDAGRPDDAGPER